MVSAFCTQVKTAADWPRRRAEILKSWTDLIGEWPPLIEHPVVEKLESTKRDNFTQHKIRVEVTKGMMLAGYLLVPEGKGPFPAVVVPYYDPETSVGLTDKPLRDFAYQLTRRGFVSIAVGSPGGDARKPDLAGVKCQPLMFLGYIAANCYNALASMPEVDAKRVGIVGHSYGGKWSMFGSCFHEKFACAVWYVCRARLYYGMHRRTSLLTLGRLFLDAGRAVVLARRPGSIGRRGDGFRATCTICKHP